MSRLKYRDATFDEHFDPSPNPREKAHHMSEPISSTAAGIFGWKLAGGLVSVGISSGLVTYVVMTMTKPKDEREWRVALASTLMGSIFGGAAFIRYFNLQNWVDDFFGLVGMGGIIFTCGLPSWLIIRAAFIYMEKNRDKDIKELVKDVKEIV